MRTVVALIAMLVGSLGALNCADSTRPGPEQVPARPSLTGHWVGMMVDPFGAYSEYPLEFQFQETDSSLSGTATGGRSGVRELLCWFSEDSLWILLPDGIDGHTRFRGVQEGDKLRGNWLGCDVNHCGWEGTWYADRR